MIDYYIRCKAEDRPKVLALGVLLGLLVSDDDGLRAIPPHAFFDIGTIYKPTGNTIESPEGPIPETAPVVDENGVPYWHANLRYMGESLLQHAQAVAAASGDANLIESLAPESWVRFFITDPDTGEAVRPAQPAVVWA